MPGELVVVKGEHRGDFVVISSGGISIGRSGSSDLALPDDTKVSHNHAIVTPLGDNRFLLEDNGSTNGTFVNDEQIEQVPLRPGDLIKIGRSLIIFRNAGSAVRLEDIALVGGGSSASISSAEQDSAPGSASVVVAQASEGPDQAYARLVLATSEPAGQALERILAELAEALQAGRAMAFLRHPLTSGLGCAAIATRGGAERGAPVDPELLSRAMRGELASSGASRFACPVPILSSNAGALYVDGLTDPAPPVAVLSSAAVLVGLQVGLDRSRQLASSATEIVALAEAPAVPRRFDLPSQLQAAERLFAPAAAQRGLAWELKAPHELAAMADPILFGRGLDKLLGYVLGEARGAVQISVQAIAPSGARVTVACGAKQPPLPALLLDPAGVAADLRRAGEGFGDGVLAVARVCFARAGVRLSVQPAAQSLVFCLDFEPPGSGTERYSAGASSDPAGTVVDL